ncbi:MAG: 3-dehydroquinate synthase [Spirochaetia bacterium]
MQKEMVFKFGDFTSTVSFCSKENCLEKPENSGSAVYVFDENTSSLFDTLPKDSCVIPPGEQGKSWPQVEKILSKAFSIHAGRDSVFTAVGGGVVSDVTGFASSVYMRGARLVIVPTSLLSMVDASLGGKTGINYYGFKNMIGTFFPSEEIRIHIGFLQTLPSVEYKNGIAEIIKTGMLGDPGILTLLEKHSELVWNRDEYTLSQLVQRSLAVKGSIVEKDLREGGIRAHLNLGHTFAHALEAIMGMKGIGHGEAVAWGIKKAMDLGVELELTEKKYAESIISLLKTYGFQLDYLNIDPKKIIEAMEYDKKNKRKKLLFILQKDICDTIKTEVQREVLQKILR